MSVEFAFLDSGTGGIPYMQYLKAQMQSASCVYLADTENFPYGEKTPAQIADCSSRAVSLILQKWTPETIVVACNTISVTSLNILRDRFPEIPIVGTVPAVKLGAKVSRNGIIGLLATEATVRDPYTAALITDFAADCTIIKRGDSKLVSFVEHELFTASETEKQEAVRPAVQFFKDKGCDTIILGCTHFIHLAREIAAVAGAAVTVIDSRDGVVRQALKVEAERRHDGRESLIAAVNSFLADKPPDSALFVTGFKSFSDEQEYRKLCKNFAIPWGGILQS